RGSTAMAQGELASSRLPPSSTSAQPSRAAGAGTWDAKCNRGPEGTAQVLGLGSNSCRICQTGHGTEPLTARAGPSLPGYSEIFPSGLTYRTQSSN
uniref:Uncharacterized protein n=1 Tax=Taeniopygia guttata TaxID=59729 RepID=A0A674G728_TAEGU